MLTGVLFAASCLLWVWIAVRLKRGRPVLEFVPPPRRAREPLLLVAGFLFYVVAQLAIVPLFPPPESGKPPDEKKVNSDARGDSGTRAEGGQIKPAKIRRDAIVTSVFNAIIVAGLLMMLEFPPLGEPPGTPPPARECGIALEHVPRQLLDGCAGFLAAVAPVMVVILVTWSFRSEKTQHGFLQLLRAEPTASNVLLIAAAAVVLAPLAEELLFRVFVQGWMQPHLPPALAILISSTLFCIAHSFPDSLPLFPLAVILGTIYYRRNSYLAVVVTHALFNAANLLLLLTSASK
jgi:membrane protease YdiL (CAAX protease family)